MEIALTWTAMEGVVALLRETQAASEYALECNKQQCAYLLRRCSMAADYVQAWNSSLEGQPPSPCIDELERFLRLALRLVKQSSGDDWLRTVAVTGNNIRGFAKACLGLSKCIQALNSWILHHVATASSSLLETPPKPVELDEDLDSALNYLRPCAEEDQAELLNKLRSREWCELSRYLRSKLVDDPLPLMDPLELENMIGSGAFCCVFKAQWMGIPVAVKEFRKDSTTFADELTICRELAEPDPNILQMIGYYWHNSNAYLVMELMEADLGKVIREHKGTLPLLACVDIMLQIADGMQFLHDRNIVHRDLKPQNILVNRGGDASSRNSIKLADFGYSRSGFVSFAPDLSYQKGTIAYMAPEMFRGENYSREVDVYSFGITAFQLLTGSLPFQSESHQLLGTQVLGLIEAGQRPDFPVDCPKELAVLITRCWNSNPKDRPSFYKISRHLNSLLDKLLNGSSLQVCYSQREQPDADENLRAAMNLVDSICMTTPTVNLHQCQFLQSRCLHLSTCIQFWSELDSLRLGKVLKQLVSCLKSALTLAESCCEADWLQLVLIKQHNFEGFKEVLESINRCIYELSAPSQLDEATVLHHLKLLAEEDKRRLVEKINEQYARSSVANQKHHALDEKGKMIKYLHDKLCKAVAVPYIEPQDIDLSKFVGFGPHGSPIFTARWLGKHTTLKSLGTIEEGERILRLVQDKQARLATAGGPSILSIVGYSRREEQLFLVTELLPQTRFRNYLPPTRLASPSLSVEVLSQLARAVRWLHDNDIKHGDIRADNILIDFEGRPQYGFTGNIVVKMEMPIEDPSSKEADPVTKASDCYRFGMVCFELLTISADMPLLKGDETLLLHHLPPALQGLVEECLSPQPPDFHQICKTLTSVKMKLEAVELNYRDMILSQNQESTLLETEELQIAGNMVVGEKLTLVGDTGNGKNRLCQWVRHDRNGGVERMRPFLMTEEDSSYREYLLDADDYDKAISFTFVDMNERIELLQNRTEITNGRWVTCTGSLKQAIQNAHNKGQATFSVRLEDKDKKVHLVIGRQWYLLRWTEYLVKQMLEKTPFSRTAGIQISKDNRLSCQLINRSGEKWNIRFKDAYSRDLAVLTLRHFMRLYALDLQPSSVHLQAESIRLSLGRDTRIAKTSSSLGRGILVLILMPVLGKCCKKSPDC